MSDKIPETTEQAELKACPTDAHCYALPQIEVLTPDTDDKVTDDELVSMLTKIAVRDLAAGAGIYDHPCSIAIRRIQTLKRT